MAELNQTDYGDHEPAGGQNGPIFTADDPPHGHDMDAPQEFDVGPAIMNAGATAYNEVIESGGTHEGAMEAMGGACSEAAAELGVPVVEFNQAMEGFTEGFNTAQMEGGDASTCINAGFDSADQAVTDGGGDGAGHDYHPPTDVAITNPTEFPDPGEGTINPVPPVELPEDMSHNWEEGPPPPEHACNNHVDGEDYGPGPELGVMTGEGQPDTDFGTSVTADEGTQEGGHQVNMGGEDNGPDNGPDNNADVPAGADAMEHAATENTATQVGEAAEVVADADVGSSGGDDSTPSEGADLGPDGTG
jgi:hypothetical protein